MLTRPCSAKVRLEFARLHHWLKAIATAQLAPAFTECRHRVDHHAHAGHPAEMIPHRCRDHAARPNDAAHLGYCLTGFGNELEHEKRQSAIERAALEGQGAGIRLSDFYSRVCVAPDYLLDKDWRIVDRGNLGEVGSFGEREGQATGAAADLENPFAVGNPCEVDEFPRESSAPAAHELLMSPRRCGR